MRVSDLRELKTSNLITVAGDARASDAAKVMATADVGAVLVVENERIAGIFTERDLLKRIVAGDVRPDEVLVRDVMTTNVRTARAADAAIDCLEIMADGRFRHLPVVDEEDRPIGMLSQRDFAATTFPQALKLASETARATVSKRYQPFAIAASVVAYTLIVVLAVGAFTA